MIKEIRIYWALRPHIKKFKELSHMKLSKNMIITGLMTAANAISSISGFLSPKAQLWAWSGQVVIEAALKVIAAFSNPDGTPAAKPYQSLEVTQ